MKLRISLTLLVALLLATAVASADPPAPPHPGPAMFDPAEWCYVMDVNMEWYFLEKCAPQIGLTTNSKTGNILWTAKAQLPEGAALPEKGAVHFTYEDSGFYCWWDDFTFTTKYNITITPNGQFNISCHFRPDKWQPE